MKDVVDMVFKIGFLLLLGVFLYFYIFNSSIGRYQFSSLTPRCVLDTKTGTVYKDGTKTYTMGVPQHGQFRPVTPDDVRK